MTVYFRPIEKGDVEELARTMRQLDRDELRAVGEDDIEDAVRQSAEAVGHSWTAVDPEGRMLCMFGFAEFRMVSAHAVPWLMGTPLLNMHKRDLIKASRTIVDNLMASRYKVLTNYVWDQNTPSIRYLRALGFDVDKRKAHMISCRGETFLRFSKTAKEPEYV